MCWPSAPAPSPIIVAKIGKKKYILRPLWGGRLWGMEAQREMVTPEGASPDPGPATVMATRPGLLIEVCPQNMQNMNNTQNHFKKKHPLPRSLLHLGMYSLCLMLAAFTTSKCKLTPFFFLRDSEFLEGWLW